MKKRFSEKAVSVLLALTIGVLPFFTLSSAALNTVSEDIDADIPYIAVVGLMASDIFADPSDPDSKTVWPPSTGSIVRNVFRILPAVGRLAITKNYDKFADTLIPAMNDILSPVYLDPDGTVHNKTGIRFEYPKPGEITKNSKLSFEYDWRVDPLDEVEKLDKFIDYVLECSGCSQVVLECHSYGGIITYAYCAVKGTEKLRSVLFNASAVFGETFTGDLCKGKLHIDPDALTEYLNGALSYEDASDFLSLLFTFLNKTGITGRLCKHFNNVFDGTHDRLFGEVIYPMFGGWPSIWSMVTDKDYDESVDYVFNNIYKDDGIDHSGLLNKIGYFNDNIRMKRTEVLNNINDTCNMYVVCRYGYCSMFCTPSWKISNDLIVDTANGSFGATVPLYGEKLSDEYIAGRNAGYISADRHIDASTCMFPEQTWFIKNFIHMRSRNAPDMMFEKLLYSDGQATVSTFEQYPRFMIYNEDDGSLTPLTATD